MTNGHGTSRSCRRALVLIGAVMMALAPGVGLTAPARDLLRSLQPERWAELARSHDRSLGLDLGM